jgi:hypothetical protein
VIARIVMRMSATRDANARTASRLMKQKRDSAKTHTLPAFARIPTNDILVTRAHPNFRHPQRSRRANRDAVSVLH